MKVSDIIKIAYMLKSLQMMSVNQIAAQIKLTEMWKALNHFQYPQTEQKSEIEDGIVTRSMTLPVYLYSFMRTFTYFT
jgi:hypothetical protein